jgi:hypothetical protein
VKASFGDPNRLTLPLAADADNAFECAAPASPAPAANRASPIAIARALRGSCRVIASSASLNAARVRALDTCGDGAAEFREIDALCGSTAHRRLARAPHPAASGAVQDK